MFCPECGINGYSRKTKTPEWRCRKCGHEWQSEEQPVPESHSPWNYGGRIVDEQDEAYSENRLH